MIPSPETFAEIRNASDEALIDEAQALIGLQKAGAVTVTQLERLAFAADELERRVRHVQLAPQLVAVARGIVTEARGG